ncbi:MAG: S24/S26 family peptidase [Eubacterium sp.]|nr:S24/S26 family peptidase [Eubacterium sp.]
MLEDKNISLTMRELMPYVEDELAKGKGIMLPIKGISMTPFLIDNRDKIILTAVNGRRIKVGDLVMFRRNDSSYAMHRVCKDNGDNTFDILGDNHYAPDRNIRYDMIVAYVPKAIRRGREVNCEKGFWRGLMIFYMKMRIKHPATTQRVYRRIAITSERIKRILRIFNG